VLFALEIVEQVRGNLFEKRQHLPAQVYYYLAHATTSVEMPEPNHMGNRSPQLEYDQVALMHRGLG
tara:strand:- start:152 stop:349 length:198 start_codon:yes stop_codon:yes gene_type:complete